MLEEGRGGQLRIACSDGVEKPPVDLTVAVLELARGREERRAEPLRAVPGGTDHLEQPGRPAGVVQPEVEVGVGAHGRKDLVRSAGLVELEQVATRRLDLGRRHALRCTTDGERLERKPNLEEVAQVVDVERDHLRALVGNVLGQSERLELAHRLPDRRNAHAERAGELVEAEGRAGLQLPHDDRLPELLERILGHRPVSQPAAVGFACRGHLSAQAHTRLIRCQTLCEDAVMASGRPRVSISQISTFAASFADDVDAYRAAGLDGIGIWELKLGDGPDDDALERLEGSGLDRASAVPSVPSILPLPLLGGSEDPRERLEALLGSLHRLAPFAPAGIVCLTGTGNARDPDEARRIVVDGLRELAAEAEILGLRIALEPYQRDGGEEWTIVSTIPEAVELIRDAGDPPALQLQFDVWHLWNTETLFDDIAEHVDRFAGVHICDMRAPTRGWADRAAPGTGIANVPRILRALDEAGFDGLYDVEIFSDDGTLGASYEDSLWRLSPAEAATLLRAAFETCWRARDAAGTITLPPSPPSPPSDRELRRLTVKE